MTSTFYKLILPTVMEIILLYMNGLNVCYSLPKI